MAICPGMHPLEASGEAATGVEAASVDRIAGERVPVGVNISLVVGEASLKIAGKFGTRNAVRNSSAKARITINPNAVIAWPMCRWESSFSNP